MYRVQLRLSSMQSIVSSRWIWWCTPGIVILDVSPIWKQWTSSSCTPLIKDPVEKLLYLFKGSLSLSGPLVNAASTRVQTDHPLLLPMPWQCRINPPPVQEEFPRFNAIIYWVRNRIWVLCQSCLFNMLVKQGLFHFFYCYTHQTID